jgi:alkanesulfonate monooxygenase SsuD/methylene tetrahydromethanopterin reductase-like flavin-dependent oxidoreductase (luciferase family)
VNIGIFDHLDRNDLPLHDFYEQRFQIAEAYDAAGFYSYHVAEHHSTPLGMAPSPGIFLSSLAQRTRRLRFGPLVYLLPLYHPLRLAEEIAMLDQISGGRLDVGIGRGISSLEATLYGADPKLSLELFEECLTVLRSAFASDRVAHSGKHYTYNDVPMTVTPLQRPHPPLWYGMSSTDGAFRCAQRGFNGLTLEEPDRATEIVSRFMQGVPDGSHRHVGIGRFVVVAGDDRTALERARRAYRRWHASFHQLPHAYGHKLVQGDRPLEFDEIIEQGTGIAGSIETVSAAIRSQLEQTKANYFMGQFVFGDLSLAESLESIALFSPLIKQLTSERAKSHATS